MNIWVDADACPVATKDVLYRAANRTSTPVTLVSNQPLTIPKSPFLKHLQVEPGFDVADDEIIRRATPGDLVITSDIPLAAEAVTKGCLALNPRGELYNKENIKARLNVRDFLDTLRSSGIQTGGSAAMSQAEKQLFANNLDKLLSKGKRPRK